MIVRPAVAVAATFAVLAVGGCAAPDLSADRDEYLRISCPLHATMDWFFAVQDTYDLRAIGEAAGTMSLAETAAADALDSFPWHPSLDGHMTSISTSLRETAATWASAAVAPDGVPTFAPSPAVIEAAGDAQRLVDEALGIEFPAACETVKS